MFSICAGLDEFPTQLEIRRSAVPGLRTFSSRKRPFRFQSLRLHVESRLKGLPGLGGHPKIGVMNRWEVSYDEEDIPKSQS